jgi:hypothetical protein
MNYMVEMFKSMDTATIKSMMSMQGMNISDDQINMMKNMNPDMLKVIKNMTRSGTGGFRNMAQNYPNTTNYSNNNISNSSPSNQNNPYNNFSNNNISNNPPSNQNNPPNNSQMPPFKGGFPDLKNMDINSMMKFMQDNPQIMNMMGPQMSQMFGPGANNEMMMKSMQNILWIVSLPSKIKAFFTSTRGMMFIMLVIVLIVSYYKN